MNGILILIAVDEFSTFMPAPLHALGRKGETANGTIRRKGTNFMFLIRWLKEPLHI
jgi:hypothetical protein